MNDEENKNRSKNISHHAERRGSAAIYDFKSKFRVGPFYQWVQRGNAADGMEGWTTFTNGQICAFGDIKAAFGKLLNFSGLLKLISHCSPLLNIYSNLRYDGDETQESNESRQSDLVLFIAQIGATSPNVEGNESRKDNCDAATNRSVNQDTSPIIIFGLLVAGFGIPFSFITVFLMHRFIFNVTRKTLDKHN